MVSMLSLSLHGINDSQTRHPPPPHMQHPHSRRSRRTTTDIRDALSNAHPSSYRHSTLYSTFTVATSFNRARRQLPFRRTLYTHWSSSKLIGSCHHKHGSSDKDITGISRASVGPRLYWHHSMLPANSDLPLSFAEAIMSLCRLQ